MADAVLLSPTFPPGGGPVIQPIAVMGMPGFDNRVRKSGVRKIVDYHSSVIRYLEDRLWQRDSRDRPTIQPDSSYFGQISLPVGTEESPINAVTTKFVRASTNKVRSPIFCTSWVPDGRRLVTGAASGEFTLWNGTSFNFESILQAHDCPVRSMRWSHNGKWMVTTDDRGFAKYWQTNFNNVHTFQAHSEAVRASSFSPLDTKLATCSDDGTVRIWDFVRCAEEHLLRGHGADVKCLDWHPRKSLLVSGSKDNQQPVMLWDPKSGQSVCTLHAHKATVMDVQWNRNGNWLVTASRDHLIKLYDIRVMKEFFVLKGHRSDVNTIAWHPVHETLFVSGGSDGAVLFWNVGNEKEIGGMEQAHEGFIWSLSWHPLGHILCSGSNDHTSKFWCRNRPGEELKDKYNTFSANISFGDEIGMGYSLPGMGAGFGRGSGAVLLPPPSIPHHMNNTVNLPPPSWLANNSNPFQQREEGVVGGGSRSGNTNMTFPRPEVQVLGADIIAETFADKPKPEGNPEVNRFPPQSPMQHNGPLPPKTFGEEFVPDKFGHPPSQSNANSFPGNLQGPPPPRPPILEQPRPPFVQPEMRGPRPPGPSLGPEPGAPPFRGPGEFRPRFPSSDEGNRGFGSRFSWHNPDFHGRRPSFEEERDFRWQPPHQQQNPYVYRRPSEEFDQRDSRLGGGDTHRRPPEGEEQRPPPTHGPPGGGPIQGHLHPPQRRPDEDFPEQRGAVPHHHGSGQIRDFPERFGEVENHPPGRPGSTAQPHLHRPPPPQHSQQHPHPDGPMRSFPKEGPVRPAFPPPGREQSLPSSNHSQHPHPSHPGGGPVRQFPEGGGPGRHNFSPPGAEQGLSASHEHHHNPHSGDGSVIPFTEGGHGRPNFSSDGDQGPPASHRVPTQLNQHPHSVSRERPFPEGRPGGGRTNFIPSGDQGQPQHSQHPHPGERQFPEGRPGGPNFLPPGGGDEGRPPNHPHHSQRPHPSERQFPEGVPGGRPTFPPSSGDQGLPRIHLQHGQRPTHAGDGHAGQFPEGGGSGRPDFATSGGERDPRQWQHDQQIPTNQAPPRWQPDRQERPQQQGRPPPDSEGFHARPGDQRDFRPDRHDFHPERLGPSQHGFDQGPPMQQQSLRDPRLGGGNRPGPPHAMPPRDQQFFDHPQEQFERGPPPASDNARRQGFNQQPPPQEDYLDPPHDPSIHGHPQQDHPQGRGPPHPSHGPPHRPPHQVDHGPQQGRPHREHFDHPQQQFERGPPIPDNPRRPGYDQQPPPQEEYPGPVHDQPPHGPPITGRGPPGLPRSHSAQHQFGQSGPQRFPTSSGPPPQRIPHSSGPPHDQHQQGFFHSGDARQPPGPPRGHGGGELYENCPPMPEQEFRGQFHRHPPPGEQHPADPRMQRGPPNPQTRPESGYQQHHMQQTPQHSPDMQLARSASAPTNDAYFHRQPERSYPQQQQEHGFHANSTARPSGGMGFHNQPGPSSDHRNEPLHRSGSDPRFDHGSGGPWQGGQVAAGRGAGQGFRDPRERRERDREGDQKRDEHDKRERNKLRSNIGDLERDSARGKIRERRGRGESDRLLSPSSRRKSDDRDNPPPPKRSKKDSDREKSRGLPKKK